jgi:hypothetical protein
MCCKTVLHSVSFCLTTLSLILAKLRDNSSCTVLEAFLKAASSPIKLSLQVKAGIATKIRTM